ncbi:hypothetical protein B0H14DRAFT_2589510 [Mycena olivaceomarginata]|nr:hypothetical protein B0H14DRAFT_2589510 [Mycena olivaceomarginata]
MFGSSIPDIQPPSFGPAYLEQKNATQSQKSCLVDDLIGADGTDNNPYSDLSLTTLDDAFERRSFEDELDTLWDSPDGAARSSWVKVFECPKVRFDLQNPIAANFDPTFSTHNSPAYGAKATTYGREAIYEIQNGSKLHCLPYNARITGSNPFMPWLEVVANGIKVWVSESLMRSWLS